MEQLVISPSIMGLKRTPAEKILLAQLGQRAMLTEQTCTDSNKELAEAVAMHQQTVSDLISRLAETNLLQVYVESSQANRRRITPATVSDQAADIDPHSGTAELNDWTAPLATTDVPF